MSAATEERTYRLDSLKWLVVLLIVGGAVFGNYYFAAEPLLYRVLGLLVSIGLAGLIALQTAKGMAFWHLAKGAQTEARRVVWPSRQERNQTTLVVVLFILVMAVLLWLLDLGIGALASMIIG